VLVKVFGHKRVEVTKLEKFSCEERTANIQVIQSRKVIRAVPIARMKD
jgi:hypothetical protein